MDTPNDVTTTTSGGNRNDAKHTFKLLAVAIQVGLQWTYCCIKTINVSID